MLAPSVDSPPPNRAARRETPLLARAAWSVGSTALFLTFWTALSWIAQSDTLPDPLAVWAKFEHGVVSGKLPFHVGATLLRVVASFAVAMTLGSAIGLAMGRLTILDRLFDGWLILFLNLPALVTIILCYIWLDVNETAALVAVAVNKIPNTAVTLREGARALDRQYLEMAKAYRFGRWKTLRHVILPQLTPYFLAAGRTGLALVWKIVLVVELLGLSSGVGFQLHSFFQNFDVASILAYSLTFIVVIQLIEFSIIQPWERSVNRWRK